MTNADHAGVFAHPIRPSFYEIDSQGVMFNMWYLAHIDDAITMFFEHRGLPYAKWPSLGFDTHLVRAELDWKAGITETDRPEVLLSPSRIGKKSFTFDFGFRKDGQLTCMGRIVYAAVATDGSGAVPLPAKLINALGEVVPLVAEHRPRGDG